LLVKMLAAMAGNGIGIATDPTLRENRSSLVR
jgi:hypothetical protein